MNIEKWLYFRTVTAVADDDGDAGSDGTNPTSFCIPSSRIKSMHPHTDTILNVQFHPIIQKDIPNGYLNQLNYEGIDQCYINVSQGKIFEVMAAISAAVTNPRGSSFVVVADDVTGEYLDRNITSCGALYAYPTPYSIGMHEYIELITPASDCADDDVIGSLSIKLPAQCILLEGALITRALAGGAAASCALEYHSAAIADDAASAGTEFVGADASGNTSIPDADLNFGSGDIVEDTVHSGTAAPVDRGTAETHFQLVAKEGSMANLGTARILVYVKWWGSPAVSV